ncbi:MAG: hypothetical protein JNJ54_04655 [Myxococcaceae bacterium]|nr:hypothetical protein [Myxococcaceae bacterium]
MFTTADARFLLRLPAGDFRKLRALVRNENDEIAAKWRKERASRRPPPKVSLNTLIGRAVRNYLDGRAAGGR